MLSIERQNGIKEILAEKKSVTVAELSKLFNVTEETIRRDLNSMEKEGLLIRTYGGAFIQEGTLNEIDYSLREANHVKSKKTISEKCTKFIQNGDSVFLDSSTTAAYVAKAISKMKLTVLTDSLKIISMLSNCDNIKLIGTGGEFSQRSMSFIGPGAINSIKQYYVDIAFISCRSISLDNQITDSNEYLAEVRRHVIERADRTFVIADFSKFGRTSFYHICNFQQIDSIITDKTLDENWHTTLAKYNVKIYDEE
ncbi:MULTISPECIES: DeoR/GlpR family DNA-binding transcription regulator [Tepidanaerobacter]|uniref:DNA-binding transcriptional regulator of sugar metabolism, DeoR/GlpR family n=1 Tax=Tepidanaerobacter syntrophicus TaxID=224999 RepID=A0A0U9HID1_9FIRM|nr:MULTISPECIES: DeoR/GlpR family DNA-binding transcription regulator [Tepidanaerobacter]GAQ25899.1 DNA-binding transcriptional regulator of sugar metabolism, DeoR/GlpR family [Tepidanaerobacter syntrophicus]GLI50483.1 putative HTH-type transcriptional regulator YulB [Tepidanaerobacter syntrophicus]HHV82617.1 DeoR/GlpR transcriptional regulator [Tepidanaerobacter syntrophicus]